MSRWNEVQKILAKPDFESVDFLKVMVLWTYVVDHSSRGREFFNNFILTLFQQVEATDVADSTPPTTPLLKSAASKSSAANSPGMKSPAVVKPPMEVRNHRKIRLVLVPFTELLPA
mmetsp:Transcript_19599/g.30192  ORF Transcript_19599/g.30192 Transcript_19599/m.30192 type:complete len:116 (+) Transcript_19599:2621-2968(+)